MKRTAVSVNWPPEAAIDIDVPPVCPDIAAPARAPCDVPVAPDIIAVARARLRVDALAYAGRSRVLAAEKLGLIEVDVRAALEASHDIARTHRFAAGSCSTTSFEHCS